MQRCAVCGRLADVHVSGRDSTGRVVDEHYCTKHAPPVDIRKVSPVASVLNPPWKLKCQRCGEGAFFHVSEGTFGNVSAVDLCEKYAAESLPELPLPST